MKIDETLKERASTHGDFEMSSLFVQSVKDYVRTAPNWDNMKSYEKESIDMIIHKIARWCWGTSHPDHPHDVCGYSKLSEDLLLKDKGD